MLRRNGPQEPTHSVNGVTHDEHAAQHIPDERYSHPKLAMQPKSAMWNAFATQRIADATHLTRSAFAKQRIRVAQTRDGTHCRRSAFPKQRIRDATHCRRNASPH